MLLANCFAWPLPQTVTKEQVDRDSADQVKAAVSENPPPTTT